MDSASCSYALPGDVSSSPETESSNSESSHSDQRRSWQGPRIRRPPPPLPSTGLLFLFLLCLAQAARARRLPDIYWNSTNPIFRVDNTDHVMGVQIRDHLNFVCPFVDPDSLYSPSDLEYSEIYRVSKWSYDACELGEGTGLVGVCNTPNRKTTIGIVFREFTPIPGGLEYHPGSAYYFISTSNGSLSGINNQKGGLCARHNVKMKIEVLPSSSEEEGGDPMWRGGSAIGEDRSPAPTAAPPARPTPSPTPLMYIIHTRAPGDEDDVRRPREHGYDVPEVVADEDEDGGASSMSLSALLFFCSSVLLLPFDVLPQLWPPPL